VSDPHAANVPRIGIDLPSAPRFGRSPCNPTEATMPRTLTDYEKLKAIANAEISRIPECAGFAVGIVAHLPDETGCNWDIKVTRKGPNRRGAPLVREAMLLVRGRYNLRAARA
jgi:hypothetical protein